MRANIDASGASGADGSGSGVLIYTTPDFERDRRGASVHHGSFEANSPGDRSRVEVVELDAPHVSIRVRASDVRIELNELIVTLRQTRGAIMMSASQESRDRALDAGEEGELRAFRALSGAVLRAAAGCVTLDHLQEIAHLAFAAGEEYGENTIRLKFHELMKL